jgi:hypothetical protein
MDDLPTSAAANYGEIPVAAPPGAKFAQAMLSLIGNRPLVGDRSAADLHLERDID